MTPAARQTILAALRAIERALEDRPTVWNVTDLMAKWGVSRSQVWRIARSADVNPSGQQGCCATWTDEEVERIEAWRKAT